MSCPLKLKIVSDENELEYQGKLTPYGDKVKYNTHKYTKSESKLNQLLGLTDLEIEKALKNQTMIAI